MRASAGARRAGWGAGAALALGLLVGAGAPAAAEPPRILSSFDGDDAVAWTFSNGPEFPGARGGLTTVRGRQGRGRALTHVFDCARGRPCGRYVAAVAQIPAPIPLPSAAAIAFRLDQRSAADVRVRLTDSTGRTFQIDLSPPGWPDDGERWRRVILPVSSWARDAWGGTEEAPFTGALTGLAILAVHAGGDGEGVVAFDDVAVIDLADNAYALRRLSPLAARLDAPAPAWGAALHEVEDWRVLDAARDAGFSFVRTDLFWHDVETERGIYEFARYERLMDELDARNLGALFILDYWNDLHGGREGIETGAAFPAYESYARAAAAQFAGRNVVYEIWNEPDVEERLDIPGAHFARLIEAGVRGVRAADPAARIITGGLSFFDAPYVEETLAALAPMREARALIGFGVHYYRGGRPETAYADDLALSALLSDRRLGRLGVWNTEWGYSSANLPDLPKRMGHAGPQRRRQAVLAVRSFLTAWAMQLPANVWYDLRDDGLDPRENEHNHGLLTYEGRTKPAFTALRAFLRLTNGARLRGFVRDAPPGVHIARFDARETVTFVVWCEYPGGRLRLSPPPSMTGAYDLMGDRVRPDRTGTITVDEAEGPVYIVVER
ncbi:MAG: cellulase family glycosylhydrolase [Hyphomonadaceae bacterium]|nr:cellulase family glycosylhydrolase [Hyphomonadaceae bacterium]